LRIARLLLPLLALRALVPAGFMPAFDGHRLTLSICPGEATVARADAPITSHVHDAGAAQHEHHHSHGVGSDNDGNSRPHFVPCPFAAAAGPALASTVPTVVPLVETPVVVDSASSGQVTLPTVLRTQSPRAPPLSA
jgi:hypothetical protein